MAFETEGPDFPDLTGLTQALKRTAQSSPDKPATICSGRTTSWAGLQERVSRLAGGLSQNGVGVGDRVAILALNSDQYTEALYATWWAGACVVPINTRLTKAEVLHCLQDAGARAIFVDPTFLELVQSLLPQLQDLGFGVLLGQQTPAPQMVPIDTLIQQSDPVEDQERSGDDLAGIYYTGGTTGFPKGVMITHHAQCHTAKALAIELGFKPGSIYLHAAPMFHAADLATGGAAALAGATNTYLAAFTPDALQDIICDRRVTHSLLVPTMIGMLVGSPTFRRQKLSSLEFLLYGASPMPMGIMRDVLTKLPDVSIAQGYGQTETVPITILPPDYHALHGEKSTKLASAGRAAYGVEIKICDPESGREVASGEVGEIVVKSPNTMTGYWKLDDITQKTLKAGWIHTGDAGYLDKDGFLFISDRLKDMIITGGENVYSAEVESVLSTHPEIAQVAVIGVPSKTWGESVHAVAVPRAGAALTADDVISYCRGKLAGYKIPRSVDIRMEPLPVSGAGKVLKRSLRDAVQGN